MKLLTKAQIASLPKLYETESVPIPEKVVRAKLFHPLTQWTWYVIEFDGVDMCWGVVVGHETEFGYFSLKSLSELKVGLPIERDMYFRPTQVRDMPIYNGERVAA